MAIKHTIKKNASYYLTLTVVEWADVFTRKNHIDAIIESLRFCIANKGLNIYSYCLMTNHLHMVVNCDAPFELKDVIRDFKRHTTKIIIEQIKNEPESRREWLLKLFEKAGEESKRNKNYKMWQTSNHALELFNEKFTWEKINYIHNNPVSEGFVNKPEDWKYSSASNYNQETSLIPEVYCLPGRLITV
jgi:putative transposase